MKKKILIPILSILLLLQLSYYSVNMREQKKEVRIPTKTEKESISFGDNIIGQKIEIPTLASAKIFNNEKIIPIVAAEETTFTENPSAEYYEINSDYMGWLTIGNTVIDYPVVRGKDNEYYLHHNFYGEEDILGAIFMDYRNIGMGLDQHTVIYGHYTTYGQMFRELENYLDEEFLLNNQEFTFNNSYTDKTYKVFSVQVAPANTDFIQTSFNENEYENLLTTLRDASIFSLDVPISQSDKILTLVSCNYSVDNGRLFVHAVEVPE